MSSNSKVVDGPETSKVQTWKEKLITHEDAYHHHKILGVTVLIMMFVRFCMVGEGDMGFASHPNWTYPTLLVHFLLNASSLHFKIPKRRIKDGGRIWPEYRLHAAVFAIRSMVTILIYHVEKEYNLEPNYNLNYFIIIGGMLAADAASWLVGDKYNSRSVRDLDSHPAAKFFFSFIQFNANAGLLFGLRRFTLPFLIIFVTQTTPFVATLRRKNMFNSNWGGAFVYGAMLAFSAVIVQIDYINAGPRTFAVVRTLGQIAALQRMTPLPKALAPLQNKYVVWTCAFLLIRSLRPHFDDIPVAYFKLAWAVTFLACLFLGYYKTQKELKEKAKIKSI
jgi:hypothetical protein